MLRFLENHQGAKMTTKFGQPYRGHTFAVEARELQPSGGNFIPVMFLYAHGRWGEINIGASVLFNSPNEAIAHGEKAARAYIDELVDKAG
jgi:hypothetical protein